MPTQHSDDYMRKQYFQQVNQVDVMGGEYNFFNYDDERLVYGVETGYTCCTTNMHQSYPKYVQNLWYATADNGLAALVYGASSVTATVADGQSVTFTETTDYPFEETIRFEFTEGEAARFPLHLRIPQWTRDWTLTINGETQDLTPEVNIVKLTRDWTPGDKVELTLPMHVSTSRWAENSVGIERGPLVYALKLSETWTERTTERWPHTWYEVKTEDAWNYGIPYWEIDDNAFTVTERDSVAAMPWNLENAPVSLTVRAARIPEWQLYNHSAGPPARAHPRRARRARRDHPHSLRLHDHAHRAVPGHRRSALTPPPLEQDHHHQSEHDAVAVVFVKLTELFYQKLAPEKGRLLGQPYDLAVAFVGHDIAGVKEIARQHAQYRHLAEHRVGHLHPAVLFADVVLQLVVLVDQFVFGLPNRFPALACDLP